MVHNATWPHNVYKMAHGYAISRDHVVTAVNARSNMGLY